MPRLASRREVAFTPALREDEKPERIEPGTGHLQPGGLVVHTGWSYPPRGERVLRQHPAYEGGTIQPWRISTPDGHRAARFPYLTRPDAEAAAARITAALPGGTWPADADTTALLPLALEASEGPELLPLTHRGQPDWGSGYGLDFVDFWMPDTRDEYERMIAAHGRIPKNCRVCARQVRAQKKAGYLPNTSHWPLWSVPSHRGSYTHVHCSCMACMRLTARIGSFGPAVDEDGHTVPGSKAVSLYAQLPQTIGGDVPLDERPFAWFDFFLNEGGCVVIDERDGVGLWPEGGRHDDALFCETGITEDPDDLNHRETDA